MPLSVCKKLNASWEPYPTQIVQLDKSRVRVVGELNNVLLTLSLNLTIHQIIDIVIVDIPEAYGMWLSRDWSEKLKVYFAKDWSHLWLPLNGNPNKLKVDKEPFMKQTIANLYSSNESVSFFDNQIEHFTFDTFFGDLPTDVSPANNV